MKTSHLTSTLLMLFAGHAMADGIYVTAKVGGSHGVANDIQPAYRYVLPTSGFVLSTDHFTDNVVSWGGAVGYEYKQWLVPLRMEVEYLYRNHYTYDTGLINIPTDALDFNTTVDTHTVLANFFVDVPVTQIFGFTFGAGLGEAINQTNLRATGEGLSPTFQVQGSEDKASFSWMGTAGIFVKPLKFLTLDLTYRYSGLGDIAWRGGMANGAQVGLETDNYAGQELYFGVRAMVPNMIKKYHHYRKKHAYSDK